jgi:hypothetical protein
MAKKQGKAAEANGRARFFEANYEHVPVTGAFAPITIPFAGGFNENPEAAMIEAVREALKSAGGKIRDGHKLIIHLRPVPDSECLPASKPTAHPKRSGSSRAKAKPRAGKRG